MSDRKRYQITQGDCLEVLKAMPDASVDSIVTDPPYGLEFMGAAWDRGVPPVEVWIEALRVLKPGGHLLAFAGTRTQHRMATAIEDSGFTIRDMIAWVYGGGFPKSHNIGKAIDKAAGAAREVVGTVKKTTSAGGENTAEGWKRPWAEGVSTMDLTAPATDAAKQWEGWGTALKPALEPITVARKPFKGTVAANVLEHGTGAINVGACKVGDSGGGTHCTNRDENGVCKGHGNAGRSTSGETFHGPDTSGGRWPANLIHDGSPEVLELFPESQSGGGKRRPNGGGRVNAYNGGWGPDHEYEREASSGSAARFFYCAKASQKERNNGAPDGRNAHPTVKPVALMRYLCRLVTPPGGLILDPFTGSGTTGVAAILEGFDFVGAELDPAFVELASGRIDAAIRGEYGR